MHYTFIQVKGLRSIPYLFVVRLVLNGQITCEMQCCKTLEKLTDFRMKNAGEYWAQDWF